MKITYIIFTVLFFTSCNNPSPSSNPSSTTLFTGNAMTIDYRIIVGQQLSDNQITQVEMIIQETFESVNNTFNKWNPQSELSRLNQLPAGEKIKISSLLENLLKITDEVVKLSHRRFDPTIEPIQQLWKEYLYVGSIPSPEEIKAIKPAVGWDKIHFHEGWFWKDHDLTSLDLGGIAKGLCVDLIVEHLHDDGFENVFVEWGGEIRVAGYHPDNRPWQIFISRFGDILPDNAIASLNLHDQAIATSGDYEQFWKIEVPIDPDHSEIVTYFHVVDPFTYEPLKITPGRVSSSSVVAETCALADGLATVALSFETLEEAQEWSEEVQKEVPGIAFWLAARTQGQGP